MSTVSQMAHPYRKGESQSLGGDGKLYVTSYPLHTTNLPFKATQLEPLSTV